MLVIVGVSNKVLLTLLFSDTVLSKVGNIGLTGLACDDKAVGTVSLSSQDFTASGNDLFISASIACV
jgi:hypothetical protein